MSESDRRPISDKDRPAIRWESGDDSTWVVPRTGLGFGGLLDRLQLSAGASLEREIDAGRGFYWLPVAFGSGALAYFALPAEPWVSALSLLSAALWISVWRLRDGAAGWFRLLVVAAIFVTGVTATKIKTDRVATPRLERQITGKLSGWIEAREARRGGFRLTLRLVSLEGVKGTTEPKRVTVTVRGKAPYVGQAVQLLARLRPSSGPVLPGGYDFGLSAFYQGVGGTGFAYGAANPVDLGPPPLDIRLAMPLEQLREGIRERVVAALPGDVGRIATALIIGDAGGLSEEAEDDMRQSGLAHVLSVSGLHMVLVAGVVFWSVRALLALVPGLALRRPIKQWAALAAILTTGFYLLLSGLDVAAQRSFIMTAVTFLAILCGRRAISMRNVAIAGLLVLAIAPESILAAGFQMSFAATIALVAGFEALSKRSRSRPRILHDRSRLGSAWHWLSALVGGLAVTSMLGGIGTTPFALYHFQRMAPLSIVANVAAMPLIDFFVMPLALLTVLLMPFGLDGPLLGFMGLGIDGMLAVARSVTEWSNGSGGAAMPSEASLLLFIAGFLWLTLMGERWRFAGLLPMLVGGILAFLPARPDLLVAADGREFAIRAADGRYHILARKADAFITQGWLRADGDPRDPKDPALLQGTQCDGLGCIAALPDGRPMALTLDRAAFEEDCRRSALIVTPLVAPRACAVQTAVIDRDVLDRSGSLALTLRKVPDPANRSDAALASEATEGNRPHGSSSDVVLDEMSAETEKLDASMISEPESRADRATSDTSSEIPGEHTMDDEDAPPAGNPKDEELSASGAVAQRPSILEQEYAVRTAFPVARRPWMPPLRAKK